MFGKVPESHSNILSHFAGPGESKFHSLHAAAHVEQWIHRLWSKKNAYWVIVDPDAEYPEVDVLVVADILLRTS
jgi:hypothetical protein